ncbi:MAG TPA: type II secretion system protein [Longimicrobiaceae bacterium]|nr:type II secretion system protein [Longimicrobiaceae bacterium]
MSSSDRAPARGQAGFTLAELIVSLVISGLLATVIFQLVQGQSRFSAMQGARAEVQQNSRGALELITSEIRSLPAGSIESAGENGIGFLLPRAWGLVCTTPPNSGRVGVVFPPGTFPTEFPTDLTTDTGWGLAMPGAAGGYVAARVTASTVSGGACPDSLGVPTGNGAVMRQFTYSALPSAVAAPTGTPVYVYQRVEYDVALSSSGGPKGYWVRRRSGAGNPEPMAGPLLTTGTGGSTGLRFTYLCPGRALTASELAASANRRRVARIKVAVAMQSRSLTRNTFSANTDQQQQSDSMTVSLRNNTGGLACPIL